MSKEEPKKEEPKKTIKVPFSPDDMKEGRVSSTTIDREAEAKKINENCAKNQITAADLDEVLALLPATQAALISLTRYGADTWPTIAAVRDKINELKGKIK